jgi:hypothetical protein
MSAIKSFRPHVHGAAKEASPVFIGPETRTFMLQKQAFASRSNFQNEMRGCVQDYSARCAFGKVVQLERITLSIEHLPMK